MLMVHETYQVTWKIGDLCSTLRVAQPDVERLLAVLVFNRATTITCHQEQSPFTSGSTGVSTIMAAPTPLTFTGAVA